MRAWVMFVVALGACARSQSVECPSGILCPQGSTCGVPTGCIFPGDCGDGAVNGDEICDDGNLAGGDGCSADCLSLEICGNGIVDTGAGETCDDSNSASHDGCSSHCQPETLTWSPLPAGPSARIYAAAVWDAGRGRVVVQGGQASGMPYLADTWYERDGVWTQGPDGPAITRHAIASDGRGTILAFGGDEAASPCSSVVNANCRRCSLLDEDGWSPCPTYPGAPTTGRNLHAMTTAADGSILMFGGLPTDGAAPFPYRWSQGSWTILGTNPTPPRYGAAMAFDPVTKRSFVIGGAGGTFETWRWEGTAWQTEYSGLPRYGLRVVYEPRRKLFVAWGGIEQPAASYPPDVMTWDAVLGWTAALVPQTPQARAHHVMVYDAILQGIVVFGGATGFDTLGDAWLLRLDDGGIDENCDGGDADGDTKVGCDDEDCWARCTPYCVPGAECDMTLPRCGDGACNTFLEDHALCPSDC